MEATVANQWQVLALPCGSALPNATTTGWVNAPTNPFTLPGLTPDTCYTFYVRAVCSPTDSSTWSTGVNATTQQVPPACGGTFTDTGGANGNYANNANITTTICPDVTGNVVIVNFASFQLENNFDNLSIYDGNTTGAPLLGTYTGTNMPPQFISSAANGCLTFLFTSDGSVTNPGWVANIICAPPPTCPQPNGLSITATTSTGATLAWNETGTSTSWNIVVQPVGTGYPNASSIIIPAGTNPFSVTGLNPSTQYEFYVQSDCGGGDISFWSGPRAFSTLFPGCAGNAAAGDACATATPICNLNGYCGNTSATYSDSSWPELDTAFCGSLENNSFLTFIATATTISFQVNVGNCANNDGIQMMIFSAANCGSGPVTSLTCWNPGTVPTGPATVSASGLVIGNTYYLMVDGWANDVCDYSITAAGGGTQNSVDITPATATVCLGSSIDLVASGGNGTFVWSPSTDLNTTTGATVTYTPSAVGTYTITVDSTDANTACSSTDTTTITVVAPITPTFDPIGTLCIGDSFVLPTTSLEGVTGLWTPAIDNTTTTTYTFAPTAGQCAVTTTMEVIISASADPLFTAIAPICTTDTAPVLLTSSDNGIVGTWNPATIDMSIIGTTPYMFTPNASCGTTFTLDVTIIDSTVPTFDPIANICQDQTAPSLPVSSTNTTPITGTWNPATIDSSTPGLVTYTFTPDAGQCATTSTLSVTIDAPYIVPTFNPIANICQDQTAPALPVSSTNTTPITGTWNPATIDSSTPGLVTYTFTPDAGQCATTTTLDVTIDAPNIVVTFNPITNICQDQAVPSLPATSLEGVSGTWSPATIDSSVVGTFIYNFNPNSGQCATTSTLSVTIDAPYIVPTFNPIANICQDQTAPALPVSSTNTTPITGTWNPATIDSSTPGLVTYTFTPDAGQCATTTTLDVTIDAPNIVVTFNPITNICQDQAVPSLPATSLEGVSGTWSPATIDSSVVGTFIYNFNPNSGQCATTSTLSVTIDAPYIVPTFNPIANICQNQTAPSLPVSSTNATPITGTWNPAAIDSNTPGLVTYTFTPNAGQCAVSTTLDVTVISAPIADTFSSTQLCAGSTYTLPLLSAGNSYHTQSGGLGTTLTPGSVITVSSTQTIYVYAPGTIPSCSNESSFTITAVDAPIVTLTGGCINNIYLLKQQLQVVKRLITLGMIHRMLLSREKRILL